MPYSLSYNKALQIIETRFLGLVSIEDMVNELEESHRLATERECALFLGDATEAEIGFNPSQLYDMPELFAGMGGSSSVMVAVVPPKNPACREMVEFYVDFASNRGFACQSFDSVEEAQNWLTTQ